MYLKRKLYTLVKAILIGYTTRCPGNAMQMHHDLSKNYLPRTLNTTTVCVVCLNNNDTC